MYDPAIHLLGISFLEAYNLNNGIKKSIPKEKLLQIREIIKMSRKNTVNIGIF